MEIEGSRNKRILRKRKKWKESEKEEDNKDEFRKTMNNWVGKIKKIWIGKSRIFKPCQKKTAGQEGLSNPEKKTSGNG